MKSAWFNHLLENVPDDPFYQPRRPVWLPPEMVNPPHSFIVPQSHGVERRFALLINPFYPKDPHASFGKHVLTPSLALTSVAGATPQNWRVEYWDENLLQPVPLPDKVPEVVGITVHLTFAQRAYDLADWHRSQGSTVVLGGLHVLSCPDEAAQHADAIAIGDGVHLWPSILRDVEQGSLQRRYSATYESSYDLDPPPRRNLLPRRSFLTTSSLIATRGCHNRCGFCYLSTEGLRMPYRVRDTADIVRQFEKNGEPYGVFVDNNLGSQPEYLFRLCRALRSVRKIWSAAVTLDVTDDPRLVREMALAGCTGVFIGFESLADGNLAQARKRTPRTDDYARRVSIFHDHGIQVNGSFVLGFDGDDRGVFQTTADWIETNRLECATFHILTPYPGTPLFRQMEGQGRLLHRDWSKYDTAHVVFQPKQMTPEELAWVRLALSPPFLARLHLAPTPASNVGGGSIPGDELSLQAFEPALAFPDPTSAGACGLAPARRMDPYSTSCLPAGPRQARSHHQERATLPFRASRFRRSVILLDYRASVLLVKRGARHSCRFSVTIRNDP